MTQNTDDDKRQASRPSATTTGSFALWLAFGFLTFNTVQSAYRARRDPWTVAFVLFAYFDLLALLAYLRAYQKLQAARQASEGLKVAIWVLANALNFAFAYHVAQMMPLVLYAFVWAMSGFTALVTFYVLFVYREPEDVAVWHRDPKNDGAQEVSKLSPEEKV